MSVMLGVLICLVSMVRGKCFAYGGSIGGSSLRLLLVWVLVLTAGNTARDSTELHTGVKLIWRGRVRNRRKHLSCSLCSSMNVSGGAGWK